MGGTKYLKMQIDFFEDEETLQLQLLFEKYNGKR